MNSIDAQLAVIKREKRVGLMTHVIVGYPSLEETETIIKVMEKSGVDFIELQIPFSDPLADGPTIMRACEESLRQGTKVKDAFGLVQKLRKQVSIPLLFMAYYNTVFRYGVEKFCRDAQAVGIQGLIIPDIPLEEEAVEGFLTSVKKHNLYAIRVVSPASTTQRLEKNAEVAQGFVYCTARQGTTGARGNLDPEVVAYLRRVGKVIKTPLAVGFGISKREHVTLLAPFADIAVIGSAIIDVLHETSQKKRSQTIEQFLKPLVGVSRKV